MENYEQKYKEALKVIESLYNVVRYQSSSDALLASQTIEKAFPELRESEDEKIRKELIEFINQYGDKFYGQIAKASAISWLEKQGEQKSWSEEDEKMRQETIDWFEKKCFPYALESENPARESIKWLKSLKDRAQLQQKQEWSEEDKQMIRSILCYLNEFGNWLSDKNEEKSVSIYKAADWLKSLKPNHWKPSEEQMKALETTIHISNFGLDIDRLRMLESLYNDLKKL